MWWRGNIVAMDADMGVVLRRTEDIALVPSGRGSVGGCDEVHPAEVEKYSTVEYGIFFNPIS